MRMTFCASVFALAIAGVSPGMPAQATEFAAEQGLHASIDIPRIKSALKLTPQQARYWAPVAPHSSATAAAHSALAT